MLAEEPFRSQIDWQKIQFFFGDERLVLPDDEKSNFRMANESLFSKVEIPEENIHRFATEKAADSFVDDYSGCGFGWIHGKQQIINEISVEMNDSIRRIFKLGDGEFPSLDLIFLGMGIDGHTASLFPQTEALHEDAQITTGNFVSQLGVFRLTFTFPTINNARNIIFLISGEDKAKTLRKVLHGKYNPDKLPSQAIKPIAGKLLFLTDIKGTE